MSNNWTEKEDKVLKSGYAIGRPVAEIADAIGRTPGAVRGRACALGISKTKDQAEKIGFDNSLECKHCGQILFSGGECDCIGARRERKIERQIERAVQSIDNIFGEGCEESGFTPIPQNGIDIMNNAAEQIARCEIHSATFVFSRGTKAKLSRGAKGAIKVERSETKKTSTEVEE